MIRLDEALRAWGTAQFEMVLKQELAKQAAELPLQQGLSCSSSVADMPITVMIHSVADQGNYIAIQLGIFYEGVIAGCSCADDPTPNNEINEYCEICLVINKTTGSSVETLKNQ
jgi:hypothetical protein